MIISRIVNGVRIGWGILTGLITAVRAARGGGPSAAELHDELHVGGPTADQMKRAREEADERWPAPAPVPRELAGTPSREDMP